MPRYVGRLHLGAMMRKRSNVGRRACAASRAICGSAMRFVGGECAMPFLQAGPAQLYTCQTVTQGKAIIALRHSGNNPTMAGTVSVR